MKASRVALLSRYVLQRRRCEHVNDQWTANCQCVGTAVTFDCEGVANGPALPGTACNDGNSNTGNDQWDANCNCVGQLIDCEGTPGGSALPGTSCNDGDSNTINDQWTANCQCVGTAVTFDCEGGQRTGAARYRLQRWRPEHGQ